VQHVYLNDRELYVHDIGQEPGAGWSEVPLGSVAPGTKQRVRVEIDAIRPDPGWAWGNASLTEIEIAVESH